MLLNIVKRLLGHSAFGHMKPGSAEYEAALREVKDAARAMAKPAVALEPKFGTPVQDDPHSSLGGQPSLPPGEAWPVEDGRPMLFLAQINYADMPHIPGYPESGLLSVFVQDEDVYGCVFPSKDRSGFRVIYHPDSTGFQRAALPEKPKRHVYGDELIALGAALEGNLVTGLPTGGCFQIADLAGDEIDDLVADELWTWLSENGPGVLYYGGHPDFVQDDIRTAADVPQLSEVLLQQGFVSGDGRQWEICWGDAGEMCLLLSEDDLFAKRFENAVYSWDCG